MDSRLETTVEEADIFVHVSVPCVPFQVVRVEQSGHIRRDVRSLEAAKRTLQHLRTISAELIDRIREMER